LPQRNTKNSKRNELNFDGITELTEFFGRGKGRRILDMRDMNYMKGKTFLFSGLFSCPSCSYCPPQECLNSVFPPPPIFMISCLPVKIQLLIS
jgi:hypothetical protein